MHLTSAGARRQSRPLQTAHCRPSATSCPRRVTTPSAHLCCAMLTSRQASTPPGSSWCDGPLPGAACCQQSTSAALLTSLRCEWPGPAHLQYCRPRGPHKSCVAPSPQHGAHTEPHAGTHLGLQLEEAHLWHELPALHASLQAPAARQAGEVCRPPGLACSADRGTATTACRAGICSKMRDCEALKAAGGTPCSVSVLAGRMLSPPTAGRPHICLQPVQGPAEQGTRHCQQCSVCRRPFALGHWSLPVAT